MYIIVDFMQIMVLPVACKHDSFYEIWQIPLWRAHGRTQLTLLILVRSVKHWKHGAHSWVI